MASNEDSSPGEKLVPNINETYQVIGENSGTCVRCNLISNNCSCVKMKNVMNGEGNDYSKLFVNKHYSEYYDLLIIK